MTDRLRFDDWNGRFLKITAMPDETDDQQLAKYSLLTALNNDFVTSAVTYGKTIISEYFMGEDKKSVLPKNLGGIAGGRKFLLRGILFKLADGGPPAPYDGCVEAASKALNNEIKAATHIVKCYVPGLYCSLQVTIDYKGFRMHAQTELPISKSTIAAGSCDGGQTVHDSDEELSSKLKLVAAQLNIKEHLGPGKVPIYLSCDVEGHRGTDGNCYVIDTALTFPPESPAFTDHLDLDMYNRPRLRPGQYVLFGPNLQSKGILDQVTNSYCFVTEKMIDKIGNIVQKKVRVERKSVKSAYRSIFWRRLRPEFVISRGRMLLDGRQRIEKNILSNAHDPNHYFSEDSQDKDCNSLSIHTQESEESCLDENYDCADVLLISQYEKKSKYFYSSSTPFFSECGRPNSLLYRSKSVLQSETMSRFGFEGCDVGNGTPLSSDALSTFGDDDGNRNLHNDEVHEATRVLVQELVPAIAEEWVSICYAPPPIKTYAQAVWNKEVFPNDYADPLQPKFGRFAFGGDGWGETRGGGRGLTESLHFHGINLRHMGLVRFHVCRLIDREEMKNKSSTMPANKLASRLKWLLLLEIVCRALKHMLREKQRLWMKENCSPSLYGITEDVIVPFLNLVIGAKHIPKEVPGTFWDVEVREAVELRFGTKALQKSELEKGNLFKAMDKQAICTSRNNSGMAKLISRLCEMTGVKLSERALQTLDDEPYFMFVTSDVNDMVPVVKHMQQVDYAEGKKLQLLARIYEREKEQHHVSIVNRLGYISCDLFRSALRSIPGDLNVRHALADMYQARGYALHRGVVTDATIKERDHCYCMFLKLKRAHENTRCYKLGTRYANDLLGIAIRVSFLIPDACPDGTQEPALIRDIKPFPTLHIFCLKYFVDQLEGLRPDSLNRLKVDGDTDSQCSEQHSDFSSIQSQTSNFVAKVEPRVRSVNTESSKNIILQSSPSMFKSDSLTTLDVEKKNTLKKRQLKRLKKNEQKDNDQAIRFLPLIIDMEHGERGLELLKEEISRLGCAQSDSLYLKVPPLPLYDKDRAPIPMGAASKLKVQRGLDTPNFNPIVALQVLCSCLSCVARQTMDSKFENNPDGGDLDAALLTYLRFHHMLLFMADKYSDMETEASNRVDRFVEKAEYRVTAATPDLGVFLGLLLLSKRGWEDPLKTGYLLEYLDRNVFFLTNNGKCGRQDLLLLEKDDISNYRLMVTFKTMRASQRHLMFQIYFLESVGRHGKFAWKSLLHLYNSSCGRLTSAMRVGLRDAVTNIKKVTTWLQFFDQIGIFLSPEATTVHLRNAVRRSAIRGYSPENDVRVISLGGDDISVLEEVPATKCSREDLERQWKALYSNWSEVKEDYEYRIRHKSIKSAGDAGNSSRNKNRNNNRQNTKNHWTQKKS